MRPTFTTSCFERVEEGIAGRFGAAVVDPHAIPGGDVLEGDAPIRHRASCHPKNQHQYQELMNLHLRLL